MTTTSTLSTTLWDTMFSFLQTGTYALTTNNIFSAYNDQLIDDKGFPLVIIHPPRFTVSKVDVQGTTLKADVVYNIEVYHKTSANCKAVVDEVINKLITGYSVFKNAKLHRPREDWFESVDFDSWEGTGRHRVHRCTIAVSYKYMS